MDKEEKKRIPRFRSREEEAEFWDTHSPLDFPDEIKQVQMRVRKPLKGVLAIRLDHKHLEELRELAEQYGVGPTTLARMFIVSSLKAYQEQASVGMFPTPKPELEAELWGTRGASDIVEGTARVIQTENDLKRVQPDEILVIPSFAESWDWVQALTKVKAVVTESGEIIAPAAGGTLAAIKKTKTGQKIKIDRDRGRVYILE
jgi:phosphohistidine swiveling domain-containing protein